MCGSVVLSFLRNPTNRKNTAWSREILFPVTPEIISNPSLSRSPPRRPYQAHRVSFVYLHQRLTPAVPRLPIFVRLTSLDLLSGAHLPPRFHDARPHRQSPRADLPRRRTLPQIPHHLCCAEEADMEGRRSSLGFGRSRIVLL